MLILVLNTAYTATCFGRTTIFKVANILLGYQTDHYNGNILKKQRIRCELSNPT
jgi:hypothetical protein